MLDYDDLLLYWHALLADRQGRRRGPPAVRLRAGRRVPGHQHAAGRDPLPALARGQGADRRRRRRPVDLRLPRGHGAQHPRLPQALSRRDDRHAGAELPQHAADPGGHERRDRPGPRAIHQEPLVRAGRRASGRGWSTARTRTIRPSTSSAQILEHREAGVDLRRQAVLFRASHHSMLLEAELARAQHPLPQVRRAEVRRDGPRQGPDGVPAAGRESARRGRRRAAAAAAAGHRAGQGAAVDGHAAGEPAAISTSGPSGSRRPARPKIWPKFVALLQGLADTTDDLPAQVQPRAEVLRAAAGGASTTTSSRGCATWSNWS